MNLARHQKEEAFLRKGLEAERVTFEAFFSKEKNPDWLSRRIMRFIRAGYSHAGILVRIGDGPEDAWVCHHVEEGFGFELLSEFTRDREIVGTIPIRVLSVARAFGWLRGKQGAEYSSSQYLGFLIPAARKFLRNDREKGVCSETLMGFVVDNGAFPVARHPELFELDFVDPKKAETLLLDLCRKYGWGQEK